MSCKVEHFGAWEEFWPDAFPEATMTHDSWVTDYRTGEPRFTA